MDLSGVDLLTLQTWRTEALAALQGIMTGRREMTISTSVNGAGQSVTYNQTTLGDLRNWIATIDAAIGALTGAYPRRRRAIGIRF
jgi:hypothetical protein